MEFFDKDIEKINSWATSIQILDFKLRHNEEFMSQYVTLKEVNREGDGLEDAEEAENQYFKDVIHNEEIELDQQLFNELVNVCTKVKELFVPMGRPLRTPKLFS